MSLHVRRTYVVPDQTAQVARAIFPDGNPVMRRYDDLHRVMEDHDFAGLFPVRGRPAEAPVRLALATLLQFMEGLTDRQAADADGYPDCPRPRGMPLSAMTALIMRAGIRPASPSSDHCGPMPC